MIELSQQALPIISLLKQGRYHFYTTNTLDLPKEEELVLLYEYMIITQYPISAFHCFFELLKAKPDYLFDLVLNIPAMHSEVLNHGLELLTEESLLRLLEQLIQKVQKQSEFTNIFNEVLVFFCNQLQAPKKSDSLLLTWYTKPLAEELIKHLLLNPICVLSLCQLNSGIYSWLTWRDPKTTLKYRIDALLNHANLMPGKLQQAAFNLLVHCVSDPEQLLTLFKLLDETHNHRNETGKKNFLDLKQVCWSLLNTQYRYKEADFLALFQIPEDGFDNPIQLLIKKNFLEQSLYQHAVSLSNTVDLDVSISAERWLLLLKHSLRGKQLTNWEKARVWLDRLDSEVQYAFLKKLINSIANPIFLFHSHQLIMQCNKGRQHLQRFDEQELARLLAYSTPAEFDERMVLIHSKYTKEQFNLGLFYTSLPIYQPLLEKILAHELFSEATVAADLFAQLHAQIPKPAYLLSIHPYVIKKDWLWLVEFLKIVFKNISKVDTQLYSLFVINSILIDRPPLLSSTTAQDGGILLHYLEFLTRLRKSLKKEDLAAELNQLTLSILQIYINKDEHWAALLFKQAQVEEILKFYLAKIDYSSPSNNTSLVLADLLLNPSCNHLDRKIKEHPDMQQYLYRLLLHPPARLSSVHFQLLFNWLSLNNKETVAQAIVDTQLEKDLHQDILLFLTPYLKIKPLLNAYSSTTEALPQQLQKLILLSFGYKRNSLDNTERLSCLTETLSQHIPAKLLAQCIDSYIPEFTNTDANLKPFIETIELSSKGNRAEFINYLSKGTIDFICSFTLQQPELYRSLLEQCINSTQIQSILQHIKEKMQTTLNHYGFLNKQNLSELTGEQLNEIPLSPLLTYQYLLYYAKPLQELSGFLLEKEEPHCISSKRAFCADASLYQTLVLLEEKNGSTTLRAWLQNINSNSLLPYLSYMENWQKSAENKDNKLLFHWLRWKAIIYTHLYNSPEQVAKDLGSWLAKQEKVDLNENKYLLQLLRFCIEKQQLLPIFTLALNHKILLNFEQIAWLCKHSLASLNSNPPLVRAMLGLMNWSSLSCLLNQNPDHSILLLLEALKDKEYWNTVISTEHSQNEFIAKFSTHSFTYLQFHEFIKEAAHPKLKTLIIICLLSQQHYLNDLKEQSVLDRLTDNNIHQPSRLNGLIQQLDPLLLSEQIIGQLPAETAFSMLCCITLFHQLTQAQVKFLISKTSHPYALEYWVRHYANLPNGYQVLAHFMKLDEASVIIILHKLSPSKKEGITQQMVEHLECFNPKTVFLLDNENEAYLILALKRYFSAYQSNENISYIQQLTDRFLNKNHVFSTEATQLLIKLFDDPHFKDQNERTAYLINNYIKTQAQIGSIEVFYENDHFCYSNMNQIIQLKPKYPEPEKGRGLFSHLKAPMLFTEQSQVALPNHTHPLIDVLAEVTQFIKALDYYIIHYKGSPKVLTQLLDAYLNGNTKNPSSNNQRKSLHHLCAFMTRHELEPKIKEAIYNSFLNHPNLYDDHISYCLFLFDTKRTLKYFGQRASKEAYLAVITLGEQALKKLDPKRHEEIRGQIDTALQEAKIELAFAEEKSFWALLFRRIKRCWLYGWTGFFNPKPPIYLAPFSSPRLAPGSSTQQPECSQVHPYREPKELSLLIDELNKEITQQRLTELVKALPSWDLKKPSEQHLCLRYSVHSLYKTLIDSSKNNHEPSSAWLEEHQELFIKNDFQLIEQLLAKNEQQELIRLTTATDLTSIYLKELSKEFISSYPELKQANKKNSSSWLLGILPYNAARSLTNSGIFSPTIPVREEVQPTTWAYRRSN